MPGPAMQILGSLLIAPVTLIPRPGSGRGGLTNSAYLPCGVSMNKQFSTPVLVQPLIVTDPSAANAAEAVNSVKISIAFLSIALPFPFHPQRNETASALRRQRALVPTPQRQIIDEREQIKDHDAGERDQEQRRE